MELPKVVLLLFALSTFYTVAVNSDRLDSSKVYPFHYNIVLKIDVVPKQFSVEETIDLRIEEDLRELWINENLLKGDWLQSRLVNQDTGEEYKPYHAFSVYDDQKEICRLFFENEVPGGANYTLQLTGISGKFDRAFNAVNLGSDSYLLSTGFDVTSLRSLFPCFDEPEFRATYNFTVYHNEGYSLIATTDEVITEGYYPENNNLIRSTFEINTPISTSSVGLLLLPNLAGGTSTDNRVTVYHPNLNIRSVLLETYHQYFLAVEEELNFPLEIPKLNVVYMPMLPTATLTKWGLILVGPKMAPIENSVIHSVELKELQTEISQSVYELFFCGMISPSWWNQRWVTRGLATYFGAVSKQLPFDGEKEFLINSVQKVIQEDRNTFTWLQESISEMTHINNPSLFIVQHKAGSVMRMIAHIMGRENFIAAVLGFLKEKQYSAITSDQFLTYLDPHCPETNLPKGMKLSTVIKGYETKGYQIALWTVHVESAGEFYKVSRNRDNYPVEIPIDYTTPSQPALSRPRVWIQPLDEQSDIQIAKSDSWIILNPEQNGLYRVDYDASLWEELIKQLSTDHTKISNRGQLISDSCSLAMDSDYNVGRHFEVLQYLPKETDTMSWRVARKSYEDITNYLRGIKESERLIKFYKGIAEDQYLKNPISIDFSDFEKTMQVGWIACSTGHIDCVTDAEKYVSAILKTEDVLPGSEDFKYLIYCTIARYSKNQEGLFGSIMSGLTGDVSFDSIKVAISGMACSAEGPAITNFLSTISSSTLEVFGVKLSREERLFILRAFLQGSYEGTLYALEFILSNFILLNEQLTTMDDLLDGVGDFVRTQEQFDVLQNIQDTHRVRLTTSVASILTRELLMGKTNIGVLNFVQGNVNLWLQENVPMPGHGNNLVTGNLLLLLSSFAIIKYLWS